VKRKAKVYIDGANIFYTQRKLGWSVDWVKAKIHLTKDYEIIEVRYYTGIKDHDEKMKRYLEYFDHIGIVAITKPLKKIRSTSGFIFKSNFDVEMTMDMLLDRTSTEDIILFSGDSDFQHLTRKLQTLGKRVIVYSSRKTLSWELKLAADRYVFLEDIRTEIERIKKPPPEGGVL